MLACPLMPITDRALVQSKGFHDRLHWATIGQQNDHVHHDGRVSAQPVEDRPFRRREGLLANFAKVPSILLAMIMYVPFTNLTPCGTIHIRAKYLSWVHWRLSWISKSCEFASEPRFLQAFLLPHHA
jgi:hypothetical protein